jgi:hypothetical protein
VLGEAVQQQDGRRMLVARLRDVEPRTVHGQEAMSDVGNLGHLHEHSSRYSQAHD